MVWSPFLISSTSDSWAWILGGSPGSCWEEKRVGTQGLWGTDEMVDETFWNRSGNYLKCIQMRETVEMWYTMIKNHPIDQPFGVCSTSSQGYPIPNKPLLGMVNVALDESHSTVWKFPPIKRGCDRFIGTRFIKEHQCLCFPELFDTSPTGTLDWSDCVSLDAGFLRTYIEAGFQDSQLFGGAKV